MLRIWLVMLALVATALTAGGCGGTSKTASTAATARTATTVASAPETTPTPSTVATGKPLTRAQLIAAADAICARTNAKLSGVTVVNAAEFARLLPQDAVYQSTEANELSKLVPPASMARAWGQMLGDFQQYSEYVSKIAQYAQANRLRAGASLIDSAGSLRQQLDVLATHSGVKSCSKQGK